MSASLRAVTTVLPYRIKAHIEESMKDMTEGNIPGHLISFAVPLVLGNIFQLTYNAVDSVIIGRFSGKEQLAAVGIANPIMNIMIFLIVGICLGAGVLMSEFFGAKEYDRLHHEISTTMTLGLAFTIAMSVICFLLIRPILFLVRTPEEIVGETALYLRVVFCGLIFCFFYNVFATALRAVGDSRTPIICVAISAVINGILDYILVAILDMGVMGAAIATVTSQGISCVLCVAYVYARQPLLRIRVKEFRVDPSLVRVTVGYSWATAMQQTVLYIGKVLVQSAVNPLGVDSIATFNAGTKIDDFAFQPGQSISHSMTTLIAQNRGAKLVDREKQGFKWGMVIEVVYGIAIFILTVTFRGFLIRLFVNEDETEVIRMGEHYLFLMGCFYVMPCVTNGLQGFCRGMGDMTITLASTTIQMLGRVVFCYILAPNMGISGVATACFAGWVCMLSYEIPMIIHRKFFSHKEDN